jgi:hypothetical protein
VNKVTPVLSDKQNEKYEKRILPDFAVRAAGGRRGAGANDRVCLIGDVIFQAAWENQRFKRRKC